VPVRFHTANGKHFSLNPKTEAPSLIFATYKGKPEADKPLHARIYGLRLTDCLKAGKRAKNGTTERVSVSLALVGKRVRLGDAFFPAKYIDAESVDHRMDLEDAIDKLTAEELATVIDAKTRENIRAFVLEGRDLAVPATIAVSSSAVQEVPLAAAASQIPTAQLEDVAPLAVGDPPPSLPVAEALPTAERASAPSNSDRDFAGANAEDTA
jgi:hypothetical protein